jgi:uncharacterized protein YbaA (DUF1428 family)
MSERPADDAPTLGEQMNHDLYLDPGFTAEHTSLVDAVRADQDETVVRAQAAVDQRRADAAEGAAQSADPAADSGEESTDQP